MENQEKIMDSEESLRVIQQMIHTAKSDFENNSFHYLLWGWLVFIASLGQYFLVMQDYTNSGIVWLLMPVGAVIVTIYSVKQKKHQKVKTYVGDYIKFSVVAMMVSLFIVLGMMWKLQLYTYPMVMMVYAGMLFIAGGALQFRPLMLGGVVNWILCVVAFFCTFEIQLLLLAMAVLLGYIIPGHLLKIREAKAKK